MCVMCEVSVWLESQSITGKSLEDVLVRKTWRTELFELAHYAPIHLDSVGVVMVKGGDDGQVEST
mgnify:CR=1 FL=1